jgi:hypothetical protein
MIPKKARFFNRAYSFLDVCKNQQELLHLQVTAIFFVTFLMVMEIPPFFRTHGWS